MIGIEILDTELESLEVGDILFDQSVKNMDIFDGQGRPK